MYNPIILRAAVRSVKNRSVQAFKVKKAVKSVRKRIMKTVYDRKDLMDKKVLSLEKIVKKSWIIR